MRRGMIQLAWRFLRFQEASGLAVWYRDGQDARGGTRKTMIVALARKLLIALWRLVTTGETPTVSSSVGGERARPQRDPERFRGPPMVPGGLAMTIRGGGDPALRWLSCRVEEWARPGAFRRCAWLHHGPDPHGSAGYSCGAMIRARGRAPRNVVRTKPRLGCHRDELDTGRNTMPTFKA